MDSDVVIFWIVLFSALSGLAMAISRRRSVGRGWLLVFSAIIITCVLGKMAGQPAFIYLAAVMWIVLVLLRAHLSF